MDSVTSVNVDTSKFLPPGKSELELAGISSDPVLLKMLEDGLLADITLRARGGSVKAHSSVLATVSPVFCAMFQHNMKEKLTSSVDILDMTIDALQLFLLLLYTTNGAARWPWGLPPDFNDAIDEHFNEIIEAARKYQVGRRLRSVLISALARNLNLENCWYYLDCSVQIDGPTNTEFRPNATETCQEYILENYDKVVESKRFLTEMKRFPELVYEMILAEYRSRD